MYVDLTVLVRLCLNAQTTRRSTASADADAPVWTPPVTPAPLAPAYAERAVGARPADTRRPDHAGCDSSCRNAFISVLPPTKA